MRPDFIIIGAMKCATSTLHDQLAAQPGFFMTDPKEPNYFSDDDIYARGPDWYRGLFAAATPGDLRGESSTHYTKLPTHPHTLERMRRELPDVRLIYLMRHPVDRLLSHYVHEWTENRVRGPVDEAVDTCPGLVDYGRYAMQLAPYRAAYGQDRILPLFLEQVHAQPQETLERAARFLGYAGQPVWREELAERNVGTQRMRKSPLRDALVNAPVLSTIRRTLVPRAWRERAKSLWRMRDKPRLSPAVETRIRAAFDEDLAVLGGWLGVELNCANFREVVSAPLDWVQPEPSHI